MGIVILWPVMTYVIWKDSVFRARGLILINLNGHGCTNNFGNISVFA
jgi:hypothetical protein